MPETKKNVGSMSRGKVREELRRCLGSNTILTEKLQRLIRDLEWAENYIKLLESNGD